MNEPKRLLDESTDELTLALLGSARDGDADGARRRKAAMLASVGGLVAGAGASAAGGGALAAKWMSPAAKWFALGALVTAVGGGVLLALFAPRGGAPSVGDTRSSANGAESPAAVVAPAQAPSNDSGDLRGATAKAPSNNEPSASGAAAIPVNELPDAHPTTGAPATGSAAPAQSAAAGLGEEAAALSVANKALAQGDARRALEALGAYEKRFPRGRLTLEAEVLRIEALARAGEKGAATVRAQRFLAAHPDSPYAHRVRAVAPSAAR